MKGGAAWEADKARLYAKYNLKGVDQYSGDSEKGQQKCPPPPKPSEKEAKDNLADYIKAAGIKSCATTQKKSHTSFSGGGELGPLGLAGNFHVQGETNASAHTSDGCEQVVANAYSFYDAKQSVQCMLNQNISNTKQSGSTKQIVEINVNGDMTNAQLKFKQKAKLTMALASQLDQKQQSAIAQSAKVVASQRNDMLQSTKTSDGAVTQGAKAISGATFTDVSTDLMENINENVTNTSQTADGYQKFTLNVNGKVANTLIENDQDLAVEAQATSMLGSAVAVTMTQTNELLAEADNKVKQESEASDAQFKSQLQPKGGGSSLTTILAFVGVAVLAWFGYKWYRKNKAKELAAMGGAMGAMAMGQGQQGQYDPSQMMGMGQGQQGQYDPNQMMGQNQGQQMQYEPSQMMGQNQGQQMQYDPSQMMGMGQGQQATAPQPPSAPQYGGQSSQYGQAPPQQATAPQPPSAPQYGGQSSQYGQAPPQQATAPQPPSAPQYGGQSSQYGGQPSQYGGQPSQYGGQPSQYGFGEEVERFVQQATHRLLGPARRRSRRKVL